MPINRTLSNCSFMTLPVEIPEATACLSPGRRFLNRAINAMPWVASLALTEIDLSLIKD
jgi:hypothetical protein